MTGSNARVVFTRRARTVGDSVRTTFGREKNTEAHGKRSQRLHTLLYGFVLSGRSGWGRRFLDELEVVFFHVCRCVRYLDQNDRKTVDIAYLLLCASAVLCSVCIRFTNVDLLVKLFVSVLSFSLACLTSVYEGFLHTCELEHLKR